MRKQRQLCFYLARIALRFTAKLYTKSSLYCAAVFKILLKMTRNDETIVPAMAVLHLKCRLCQSVE